MKKQRLKNYLLLLTFLGLVTTQMNAQTYDFDSDAQNWIAGQNVSDFAYDATGGLSGDGVIKFKRTHNNAQIKLNIDRIDATTKKGLKIVLKNNSNATTLRVLIPGGQGSVDFGNALTAIDDEFRTVYVDLSGFINWDNATEEATLYFRQNYVAGPDEDFIEIDEITFIDSVPPVQYNGFVQNPSFEGPSGASFLTGDKPFVVRTITNSEAKDGSNSLRLKFTADAYESHFTFSPFVKDYGSLLPIETVAQVKMWAKTNRAAPIKFIGRIKTYNSVAVTDNTETAFVETTNTVMGWEELTFNFPLTATADGITLWIGIDWTDLASTNLLNGDMIYIDQITSDVFVPKTASVDGTWDNAASWGGTAPSVTGIKTIDSNIEITTDVVSDGSITINATKTLTIAAGKSLTLNSDLTTNDNLVLEPGAQLIVTGSAAGNAAYKRTLTSTSDGAAANLEGWFTVSPPVSGEALNTAWADANSLANGSGSNRGLATYNENGDTWSYFSGAATTFDAGKGYIVKRTTDGTVTFTGSINTVDSGVDVAVTKDGNGFNLLGNPYTSKVNSATFLADNSANLALQQIWVWNDNGNTYNAITSGMTFKLAPGQAFFVQANAAATLNFAESNQEVGADTFQKTSNSKIKLNVNNGKTNRYTEVYYNDIASLGFDNGYEGETFSGIPDSFSLYTHLLADDLGKNYQIQSLPNADLESMIIPVGVKVEGTKEITFTVEATNIPAGLNVYLEDRQENTFTQLDELNADYKVSVNEASNGIGRFYLHTSAKSALSTTDVVLNSVSIYKSDNSTLKIAGLQNGNATVSIFNILGKNVLSSSFEANGVKEISLPKLAAGVYVVQLTTVEGKLNKKIILE